MTSRFQEAGLAYFLTVCNIYFDLNNFLRVFSLKLILLRKKSIYFVLYAMDILAKLCSFCLKQILLPEPDPLYTFRLVHQIYEIRHCSNFKTPFSILAPSQTLLQFEYSSHSIVEIGWKTKWRFNIQIITVKTITVLYVVFIPNTILDYFDKLCHWCLVSEIFVLCEKLRYNRVPPYRDSSQCFWRWRKNSICHAKEKKVSSLVAL